MDDDGDAETFLAMAVHELRAPTTVVVGLAETLEQLWHTDLLQTHGPEVLARLVRNGRHLRRLVSDLLTSAFLERGTLPLAMSSVPVRPILNWAVEAAGAVDGDVTIECEPSLHATVDADRLEQIVTNLVTNGLQHGTAPVEVRAAELVLENGVRISVRDYGRGVHLDDAAHLFERFSPLAARTSSSTGLGLSISRHLARAMGGDLTYQPADPGSRFVVTLPTA